jgi:hypothetical protein
MRHGGADGSSCWSSAPYPSDRPFGPSHERHRPCRTGMGWIADTNPSNAATATRSEPGLVQVWSTSHPSPVVSNGHFRTITAADRRAILQCLDRMKSAGEVTWAGRDRPCRGGPSGLRRARPDCGGGPVGDRSTGRRHRRCWPASTACPTTQIGLAQADCCRFAARGGRFLGGRRRGGPLTWGGAEGI